MQTFQRFKQEFSLFEQDVSTLQQNQGAERREIVRYKILKYKEKSKEYNKLLQEYRRLEGENIADEIKDMRSRLRTINIKINEINYIDYQLDRKTPIDKIRNFATLLLSLLPFFSFLGIAILFIYLKQINLNDSFYIILSETSGIILLLIVVIWISAFHFIFPYYYSLIRIENSNLFNNIIHSKYYFYTTYLLSTFILSLASYLPLLQPMWLAIIPAFFWMLSSLFFHLIFIQIYEAKNHESKMLIPVIILCLWAMSIILTTAAFNTYRDYNDNKNIRLVNLEFFFIAAGFTQPQPYYFKLDESFIKNMDNKEIFTLKKQYPIIRNGQEYYYENYLYGRIMVDLKDIKILCSVKEEDGHRFCHKFSSNNLHRMDWIPDIEPQKAEQLSLILVVRKFIHFLFFCKG